MFLFQVSVFHSDIKTRTITILMSEALPGSKSITNLPNRLLKSKTSDNDANLCQRLQKTHKLESIFLFLCFPASSTHPPLGHFHFPSIQTTSCCSTPPYERGMIPREEKSDRGRQEGGGWRAGRMEGGSGWVRLDAPGRRSGLHVPGSFVRVLLRHHDHCCHSARSSLGVNSGVTPPTHTHNSSGLWRSPSHTYTDSSNCLWGSQYNGPSPTHSLWGLTTDV